MTKLRHIDNTGTARFITFTCYKKHRYLSGPASRMAFLDELARLRAEHAVRILGYVLMPEHVHLVLDPREDTRLGVLIGRMKARSARVILSQLQEKGGRVLERSKGKPAVWQRRCYDHNCRTPDIVVEKIKYCHNNPVKRGLVSEPGDWPWSSYRWYHGRREGEFEIDGVEL
jgi:putative transposase